MKMKKVIGLFAMAGGFALAPGAQAALMLSLDAGGGNTVTVTDGGIGDLNTAAGVVTWAGSLGGWSLNVSTGYSNSPGTAGAPADLDLSSLNMYTLPGLGTLSIAVSDSGWMTPVGDVSVISNVGGTLSAGGSASFEAFFNGSSVAALGPYATGSFSGSASMPIQAQAGYELKEVATLSQSGASGPMSFDFHTQVPEPGILGLLGIGLLGIGGVFRRKA